MAWTGNSNNKVPNIGNVSSDYSNTVVQQSSNLSDKKIEINRAEEIRRDTDKQKNVSISLEDVDTAIMHQLEKFQLMVMDNGQNIKVPIYYASPEKWKSIQKDGFMRDYQGKIILPAIVFSRISSEKNRSMMTFNRYLKYSVMKRYSEKNKYTPFNLLVGQNVPINEVYDVVMPDHMIFTYHFIVWAEYQKQVNKIVERINFEAEDFWGDKRGYRFQVKLDSISHAIQLATDQDRMVKAEFDINVFGYILPDVIDTFAGKTDTTQKRFTPKKIVVGEEVVTSNFDMSTLDDVGEKWRNQNYPNLRKDTEIPAPPMVFSEKPGQFEEIQQLVKRIYLSITAGGTGVWHLPAPTSSDSGGQEGWISYDSDYYYIYTSGRWKRVPIALFNTPTEF